MAAIKTEPDDIEGTQTNLKRPRGLVDDNYVSDEEDVKEIKPKIESKNLCNFHNFFIKIYFIQIFLYLPFKSFVPLTKFKVESLNC